MKPINVFVVDDDDIYQFTMGVTLKNIPKVSFTSTFCDGAEALDHILANQNVPRALPDIIFLDINMPVMDGFGFIEAARARENEQRVPILVLTTESSPTLKARARDAGATGWIVKPFDEQKLVWAIERVAMSDRGTA